MENDNFFSIILLVALILYLISPVDGAPGPIDDVILIVMYCIVGR